MYVESEPKFETDSEQETAITAEIIDERDGYEVFCENLPTLTAAERNIYGMYVDGKSTREIIEILEISENTLKTHNRRMYKKLGISSRKQMLEYARRKD